MQENIIEVQMAQMQVASAPARLITRGLGSCLGITFYDPVKKMGAMAHPMLPDIEKAKIRGNPNRFVNSTIMATFKEFENAGIPKSRIEVKIFGGARMFNFITVESLLNIGQKNTEIAKATFQEAGVKIVGEEVGGTFGRTIELNLENGRVLVKTVAWGEKEV